MSIETYFAAMNLLVAVFSIATLLGVGFKTVNTIVNNDLSLDRSYWQTWFYGLMSAAFLFLGHTEVALEGIYGSEVYNTFVNNSPDGVIGVNWTMHLVILAVLIFIPVVGKVSSGKQIKKKNKKPTIAGSKVNEHIWKNKVLTEGDALVQKWLEMSTSLQNILTYPLLANASEPAVERVVKAVSRVRAERRESLPEGSTDPWETSYGRSVRELRNQLIEVENLAKKTARNYDPVERKKLEQARHLLAITYDNGAPTPERIAAYTRVRSVMDELHIYLSDEAEKKIAVETQNLRMIEPA